ncbi:TatD family hydrolase [Philodulcilactobacillus myokoensis]|uniref:TatD family hydrolase n=1 Tax=Philodulcilactobacillus myokoensis TaxID=2929573 RepID=A0A9W6B1P2_9LACO|nr:TatD family hydrolase [Philodulcilactobacillus myokoensis]GLB47232.1 TatD family hydrolase [Philodulcilactobacillus myokoensis]
MKIFDSHTHLNDDDLIQNAGGYVKHAKKLGVVQMNIAGSDAKMNANAIKLAHQYNHVYATIGFHPESIYEYNDEQKELLKHQLSDPKVVCIGEIGMDYHENKTKHKPQKFGFRHQLELAKEFDLPVQIHTRNAFSDTYQILKDENIHKGVIHSFNGNPEWLDKFLNLGFYVSYSGVASFKNAHDVHASIKRTPLDRMMVETDAPCLAPVPFRGQQNEPAYTLYTLEAVARYLDVNPDEVAKATYQNAINLFGLDRNEKN